MRKVISQGQKFADEMLKLCMTPIKDRVNRISLERDLKFKHRIAPCQLVVPFQAMLTPSLPASHEHEYVNEFRAFPGDATIIEGMLLSPLVRNQKRQ